MWDSDSDDTFDFKSDHNFEEQQDQKETMLSNDNNYKILTEISNSFFSTLQERNDFNHKSTWRSYSSLEPIKIKIETTETLPGILDIIKTNNNNFLNKVLVAFSSLIIEIENNLPTNSNTKYDTLYPWAVYNETMDDGPPWKDGEAEEQISRMLSYFNELYERITKLLSIAINLFNQLISLYSENNKFYEKSFKNINFELPFNYWGIVLSYFLAIDTIVSENETIVNHWIKYRTMIHQAEKNASQFNINDDQKKRLRKLISRLNGCLWEKKCYLQCLTLLLQKTGLISPSGSGFTPTVQNKRFQAHFVYYLKSKFANLEKDIGSFTESTESIQLFQYLSLFGLYCKLYDKDVDKNILRMVWGIQQKISTIHLIGSAIFTIETFLRIFPQYDKLSLDPKNVNKKKMSNFKNIISTLPFWINNMRLNVMTWVTRMESDLFHSKINMHTDKKNQLQALYLSSELRIKLIINGLSIANHLKLTLSYVLETHVVEDIKIDTQLIPIITTGLEWIKVIESEFNRVLPYIALDLNVINWQLISPIHDILKLKVIDKLNAKWKDKKTSHEELYKDILDGALIFFYNTQAAPSKLRRIWYKLCFDVISGKGFLESADVNTFIFTFWKMDIFNELSKEIKNACDCSFLYYYYQAILPGCLGSIYENKPKRLHFFASAVNDIEIPLTHILFKEPQVVQNEIIQTQRRIIRKMFEKFFLKRLSEEIEVDLRKQIHVVFIAQLNVQGPSERNWSNYLMIQNFQLFDIIIDPKRFVEQDLNCKFYKLTTFNLNNWKTYQKMRVLAKSKYNLHLHEIFLPSQTLQQGRDILEIIRNVKMFVENNNHNLHNQIFIEMSSSSKDANWIGSQQILNSLYTHGTGIVNSIVNRAYQFIIIKLKQIVSKLNEDYFKSLLKIERNYWAENKNKINYKYPYENAEKLNNHIESIFQEYSNSNLTGSESLLKLFTQMGNAVGLTRCIRTALMDYDSQNVNLLTCGDFENFSELTQKISIDIDPNEAQISSNMMSNIENSWNDSNKMFRETISALKQTGKNNMNYLSLLVNSCGSGLTKEKIEDIDLFVYLFPALSIKYVENLWVAKDNLLKTNKIEDAYFSDDGFILGICYFLRVCRITSEFENLNWFPSVIEKYEKGNKSNNEKKSSNNGNVTKNIEERKNNSYLEEFSMLYFTYSSGTVLFSD